MIPNACGEDVLVQVEIIRADTLPRVDILEHPTHLRTPEPVQASNKVILVPTVVVATHTPPPILHVGVSPLEDCLPCTETVDQMPLAMFVRMEITLCLHRAKSTRLQIVCPKIVGQEVAQFDVGAIEMSPLSSPFHIE